MVPIVRLLALPIIGAVTLGVAVSAAGRGTSGSATMRTTNVEPQALLGSVPPRTSGLTPPEEEEVYKDAVAASMTYLRAHRSLATGLVQATQGWGNITLWDIGSLIGAVYAAGELGSLSTAERDEWMSTLLGTLAEAPLFDDAAYNRAYVAASARMVGEGDRASPHGTGWSSTDLGRLLIWLKVIETKLPSHAEAARAVAKRIAFDRVVREGYLHGAERKADGSIVEYTEGRIGYEQYAALGFQLWGLTAEKSLDPSTHGRPVTVLGQTLIHDQRGRDKLTSEPFILMGMELGYRPPFDELARAMLAVQEARYKQTGTVTMVSEDAVEVPPWYFYYYSAYSEGETFAVRAHGPVKNGPRWVSAKAAFAWHALYPSEYTWMAVNRVLPARHREGWASGVFEGNGRSTGVRNLNTAAVILEAALYRKLGKPILAS